MESVVEPTIYETSMKFYKQAVLRVGDTRRVRRFAWFPTEVYVDHSKEEELTVWLETYEALQVYQYGSRSRPHWFSLSKFALYPA
jgi:hypothetical protein